MPLIERALATITRFDLIPPGARVLAAVSGGADSVALAHVLARLAPDLGCTLAGIAHLHHGLRGDDADGDAAFAEALADRLGVSRMPVREALTRRVEEDSNGLRPISLLLAPGSTGNGVNSLPIEPCAQPRKPACYIN